MSDWTIGIVGDSDPCQVGGLEDLPAMVARLEAIAGRLLKGGGQ